MTAVLLEQTIKQNIDNIYFHINHVTVPEVMEETLKKMDEVSKVKCPF